MSFNKIKIKQIDVDLSGSVYSFGTGFFLQTGVLPEISGTFLSKQDFLNSGVRLSTNQDISGVKNFFSRPTLSGGGFALLSEAVILTGSQDISGIKSFRSGVNFYSTSDFFSRPTLSGSGLARLSETVWSSGGAQDITGAKNFLSRPTLSGSGLALLSETVWSSGGAQDITGAKNFLSRPTLSGSGLARLSETVWSSGGAQDITGAKNFLSNLSAPAFSGTGIFSSSNTFAISTNASTDSVTVNFPIGTPSYIFNSGSFSPAGTTNTRNLGDSSVRWREIFCVNPTINTSDKNLKKDISEIPDEWLNVWSKVSYKRYKFKNQDTNSEKWSIGLIAQEIFEIFKADGLNAVELGLVRYDEVSEISKNDPYYNGMSGIWSIIPDACQFLESALLRKTIKKIENLI